MAINSNKIPSDLRTVNSFALKGIVIFVLLLMGVGCGQDDDQREFEQKAFQLPDGITETDFNGEVITEDPDDWRIAPFFQSLVEVGPAYPNPVSLGDNLNIEVSNRFDGGISNLRIIVLVFDSTSPYEKTVSPLRQFDLSEKIIINPYLFGSDNSANSSRDIHRIILLDEQNNIISYGDVRVK